jgi:hypothetical protein
MIRSAIAACLTAIMLMGCSADLMPTTDTPQLAEGLEPDPNYRPKEGDRAQLYGVKNGSILERIPLLKDITALDNYGRMSRAAESSGLGELEERGELTWASPGVRAMLISIRARPVDRGSAAEVRLLDGAHKNRVAFTSLEYLARLRPAPAR